MASVCCDYGAVAPFESQCFDGCIGVGVRLCNYCCGGFAISFVILEGPLMRFGSFRLAAGACLSNQKGLRVSDGLRDRWGIYRSVAARFSVFDLARTAAHTGP